MVDPASPTGPPTDGYTVPSAPWQPPSATPPPHLPPIAGLGRRLVARLIDYVLLLLVMIGAWQGLFALGNRVTPEDGDPPLWFLLLFFACMVGIPMLGEWIQLVTSGRTIGKALVGLRVVPVAPGHDKVPKGRAAARAFFFPGLAYIPPCSLIWFLVNGLVTVTNKPLRQALHDQVGRCVVVVGR